MSVISHIANLKLFSTSSSCTEWQTSSRLDCDRFSLLNWVMQVSNCTNFITASPLWPLTSLHQSRPPVQLCKHLKATAHPKLLNKHAENFHAKRTTTQGPTQNMNGISHGRGVRRASSTLVPVYLGKEAKVEDQVVLSIFVTSMIWYIMLYFIWNLPMACDEPWCFVLNR